jgi:hypothetical protein
MHSVMRGSQVVVAKIIWCLADTSIVSGFRANMSRIDSPSFTRIQPSDSFQHSTMYSFKAACDLCSFSFEYEASMHEIQSGELISRLGFAVYCRMTLNYRNHSRPCSYTPQITILITPTQSQSHHRSQVSTSRGMQPHSAFHRHTFSIPNPSRRFTSSSPRQPTRPTPFSKILLSALAVTAGKTIILDGKTGYGGGAGWLTLAFWAGRIVSEARNEWTQRSEGKGKERERGGMRLDPVSS